MLRCFLTQRALFSKNHCQYLSCSDTPANHFLDTKRSVEINDCRHSTAYGIPCLSWNSTYVIILQNRTNGFLSDQDKLF